MSRPARCPRCDSLGWHVCPVGFNPAPEPTPFGERDCDCAPGNFCLDDQVCDLHLGTSTTADDTSKIPNPDARGDSTPPEATS